jgi:hypothetical protein
MPCGVLGKNLLVSEIVLSPLFATVMFIGACLAGHSYRRVWKADGPRWQLWVFGLTAALLFGLVAFLPVRAG